MLDKEDQIYLVTMGSHRFLTIAQNRENAKRNARGYLGGNADYYIVEPLTNPGDTIHFHLSLYV